jgi:hypothetical protein
MVTEVKTLQTDLVTAQKNSDTAMTYMEKWSRREKDALDYATTMQAEEREWLSREDYNNHAALIQMRGFIPMNVMELSISEIMALARENNGLYSLELATEIKQNKLLHWIVMHPDDIAVDSFLTGDNKAYFEAMENLDIVELRALAFVMPAKFDNDKDGKKAEWRSRFFAKVRAVVSQQQREKVRGPYDPVAQRRTEIDQPLLKPEQLRRSVYFYRTKEKSQQKVKQYNDRVALLARREGEWMSMCYVDSSNTCEVQGAAILLQVSLLYLYMNLSYIHM